MCDNNSREQNSQPRNELCSSYLTNSVFRVYVVHCRLVGATCMGGHCGKRPEAVLCRTQRDPTDPPQSTAELLRQAGGTCGKTSVRKGTPKSEKRGGGTAPWQSRYPLQPVEDPPVEHENIPEGTAAHGEPTPEQRKDVRRKEWQRDTSKPLHAPPSST